MILVQNPETGYWTDTKSPDIRLRVHDPADCDDHPCAVHNHPSPHPLAEVTLNWRDDRKILERICEHGVGHPDYDAVQYQINRGDPHAVSNASHGCDGCCHAIEFTNAPKRSGS
mgnify:CR=1 FL=1